MDHSVIFLFCLSSLFVLNEAGIAIEMPDQNRKHNGYCYASEHNLGEMSKGESKTVPGTCIEATCMDDRSVKYYYCPPIAAEYPCYVLPPDPPLPGCCDRVVCDKPKIVEIKLGDVTQSLDNNTNTND